MRYNGMIGSNMLTESLHGGLYWHYDEPWSRDHCCKKGRLLMIKPVKEENLEHEEEDLDHEEEDMEEESQLADCMMHSCRLREPAYDESGRSTQTTANHHPYRYWEIQ
ncbi:hypothetical protein BHE74_00016895 [Ensete ventricosum]|nr:hypothetical protein BHE74_00016895 [Ensete ventricosum]